MKITGKIAGKAAAASALAVLLTTSAFADSRPREESWRNDRGRSEDRGQRGNRDNRDNRGYNRENDSRRYSGEGKVRSFSRERDGYRVYLDRGTHPFWIPSSRLGGHRLSVGLSIRLGGIFNNGYGYVEVDDLGWPNDGYYNDGYNDGYRNGYGDVVRGVVQRVNYGRRTIDIRSDRGFVTVDMRSLNRRSRLDINDVRRGDRITISGAWIRGGVFDAGEIESIGTY